MTDYISKRINENAADGLDISDEAIRSHARDIVRGVVKALNEEKCGLHVVCDESNNPQYNIDNNILTIDVVLRKPEMVKIIIEGNNNAKTSVGFIQQEEEEDAAQKDL